MIPIGRKLKRLLDEKRIFCQAAEENRHRIVEIEEAIESLTYADYALIVLQEALSDLKRKEEAYQRHCDMLTDKINDLQR